MEFDFSKMTDEELIALSKQIKSERQNRKALTKESAAKHRLQMENSKQQTSGDQRKAPW